ncbi:MAG: hypothetical protein M3457_08460, partial [Chloroflexota bacterium]|nr:hypothetical protein [Chloroflexota bacterium]
HADAELQFQRALELDAASQPAHYYLAELYMAWSPARIGDALVHYGRAAEIDPGTLIGERSQTQLDTMGIGTPAATPASASSTPVEATP